MSKESLRISDMKGAGANRQSGGVVNNPLTSGVSYGCIYYPAHTKNGRPVNACVRFRAAINKLPYTLADGTQKQPDSVFINCVVWNRDGDTEGQGRADKVAKRMSSGRSFSCDMTMESYTADMRDKSGNTLIDPTTREAVQSALFTFRCTSVIFGVHSEKQLVLEYANHARGRISFDSRPMMWDKPQFENALIETELAALTPIAQVKLYNGQVAEWEIIRQARRNALYTGGDRYGYSRVVIPANATIKYMTPVVGSTIPVPVYKTVAGGTAGTGAASAPPASGAASAPPAASGEVLSTEGHPLSEYSGWSEAQMLESPIFAPFIQAGLIGSGTTQTQPAAQETATEVTHGQGF